MLSGPQFFGLDSSNNLYVTDSGNHRVNKYTSTGSFISSLFTSAVKQAWTSTNATPGTGNADGVFLQSYSIVWDSAGNFYASDTNSRIIKFSAAGTPLGWIGRINISPTGGATGCAGAAVGTFTPGWCTGGNSAPGSGDGMLSTPLQIALDSSGYIYIADKGNSRVSKYSSSGAFLGWIGKIQTSPTGGATGCAGATTGTATPGWCTGGTAAAGTGDGAFTAPYGIVFDSLGNLYVSDNSVHRISLYTNSGAFTGWIGKIATSPTGGAAGCAGATVGTLTPGWCTGGTSSSGVADGQMSGPEQMAIDSSNNLYVAQQLTNRITKYTSAGASLGWVGKISTSPTGGASGCAGAATNTITPGWCIGGTAQYGTETGAYFQPGAVMVDVGTGNVYVADEINERVQKLSPTGAVIGWIGQVLTVPTGGAAGCTSTAIGAITPGWCTGGTGGVGTINGAYSLPMGLSIHNKQLYVQDIAHSRIVRVTNP